MRILILLLALTNIAYAADSNKVTINTTNKTVLHTQNNKNLMSAKEKNDALSPLIDVYQTCIDKGMIYLGAGATDVDADNCYDVTNTTNPETQFRQVVVGRVGPVTYNPVTSGYSGRFNADDRCNNAYAGSRAMTYDDIKFVRDQIATLSYTGEHWIMDAVGTIHSYTNSSNIEFVSKALTDGGGASDSAIVNNLNDCRGWNDSGSPVGNALSLYRDGSSYKIKKIACNQSARIICVKN